MYIIRTLASDNVNWSECGLSEEGRLTFEEHVDICI
jgi:hypothetical protein